MPRCLEYPNFMSSARVSLPRDDCLAFSAYNACMSVPSHDWFLVAWAKALGRKQADFVRDLGWNKSKASLVWRGEQPYTRDMVNEVAAYLNLQPYELLMHPADANAIKRFRDSAKTIASVQMAADVSREYIPPPAAKLVVAK